MTGCTRRQNTRSCEHVPGTFPDVFEPPYSLRARLPGVQRYFKDGTQSPDHVDGSYRFSGTFPDLCGGTNIPRVCMGLISTWVYNTPIFNGVSRYAVGHWYSKTLASKEVIALRSEHEMIIPRETFAALALHLCFFICNDCV